MVFILRKSCISSVAARVTGNSPSAPATFTLSKACHYLPAVWVFAYLPEHDGSVHKSVGVPQLNIPAVSIRGVRAGKTGTGRTGFFLVETPCLLVTKSSPPSGGSEKNMFVAPVFYLGSERHRFTIALQHRSCEVVNLFPGGLSGKLGLV